jgi:hypothetical protein
LKAKEAKMIVNVQIKLNKADAKVIEQIGRENYPELRSIDSLTQILAQKAVKEKILEQYGRNLAKYFVKQKAEDPEIKKRLAGKKEKLDLDTILKLVKEIRKKKDDEKDATKNNPDE